MSKTSTTVRNTLIASLAICLLCQWIYTHYENSPKGESLDDFLTEQAHKVNASFIESGALSLQECPAASYFSIMVKDSTGKTIYWNDAGAFSRAEFSTPYETLASAQGAKAALYKLSSTATTPTEYTAYVDHQTTADKAPIRWIITLSFLIFYCMFLQVVLRFCTNKDLSKYWIYTILVSTAGVTYLLGSFLHLPTILHHSLEWSEGLSYTLLCPLVTVLTIASGVHFFTEATQANEKKALSLVGFTNIGLSMSALIVLKTKLIKDVINSTLIEDAISHPLQYHRDGILFVGVMLILSILSFYISTIVAKPASASVDSKAKYLGLSIGLGLALAAAVVLRLDIPLLALTAYIISYILIMDIYVESKSRSAIFLFLWMMIYSGFIASTCFHYILKEDITTRQYFAEHLYIDVDEAADEKAKTIDSAIKQSDIFSQLASLPYPAKLDRPDFVSFFKESLGAALSDSIRLSIECYESSGSTLFRNHFANYARTRKSLALSKRQSEHLYYSPFEQCHYLKYQIQNDSYRSSPLELIVRISSSDRSSLTSNENFGYTVKRGAEILLHMPPASTSFDIQRLSNVRTAGTQKDYNYVIARPSESITIYTYRKLEGLLKPISLFSFTMTLLALILLFLAIFNNRYAILPEEIGLNFDHKSSLRNRIQFTIIALTIFSFILIGLMTIIYFKNVLEKQQVVKKEQQISSVINNVQSSISSSADAVSLSNILTTQIDKLSHIHNKSLSLYDQSGRLVASSSSTPPYQRLPFSVYTQLRAPNATYHVDYRDNRQQMVSHFVSLLGQGNSVFATLQIPDDYDSLYSNSILDFLSTILNVYIFLFLVAGTIAVAISNSITRPLSRLSEKLKLYKLGTTNVPLKWHTKDEIGSLIANYNELTEKLDESVNILAKTERDIAWREMAKQVAHEIKNPLTPMKLSIQHLQRLSGAEGIDMHQSVNRISKTLLEQFNNLDQIANSFSNFASMPKANNEKVMINEVVESIHDLFRKREDMEISLSEPINDMYVYADRNHLVRVLNNIVKNAIQAIPTERPGRIHISLEQKGANAVVTVRDNGIGIPDHMRDKVFTPNFTTKNSGTGLGLAISANMIEAFNGRIYFETEPGKGTDFIIEVPLMRLDEHFDVQNRVELD